MKKWLLHIAAVSLVIIFAGLVFVYHHAGTGHRQGVKCTGIEICIIDSTVNSFISAADVKKYLDAEYGQYVGSQIDSIDLACIEKILDSKTAVLNSEAFITKDGKLNIAIEQRKPAVRFLGESGGYYADVNGETFPIQKTYASYVPIVDGCIPLESDCLRIQKIVNFINHLEASQKWKNKFVQFTSDRNGNLTLIPRNGQEKFIFGQPEDIEAKLKRLEMYYTHIVPEKGEKAYRNVDLRFNDQIICK